MKRVVRFPLLALLIKASSIPSPLLTRISRVTSSECALKPSQNWFILPDSGALNFFSIRPFPPTKDIWKPVSYMFPSDQEGMNVLYSFQGVFIVKRWWISPFPTLQKRTWIMSLFHLDFLFSLWLCLFLTFPFFFFLHRNYGQVTLPIHQGSSREG